MSKKYKTFMILLCCVLVLGVGIYIHRTRNQGVQFERARRVVSNKGIVGYNLEMNGIQMNSKMVHNANNNCYTLTVKTGDYEETLTVLGVGTYVSDGEELYYVERDLDQGYQHNRIMCYDLKNHAKKEVKSGDNIVIDLVDGQYLYYEIYHRESESEVDEYADIIFDLYCYDMKQDQDVKMLENVQIGSVCTSDMYVFANNYELENEDSYEGHIYRFNKDGTDSKYLIEGGYCDTDGQFLYFIKTDKDEEDSACISKCDFNGDNQIALSVSTKFYYDYKSVIDVVAFERGESFINVSCNEGSLFNNVQFLEDGDTIVSTDETYGCRIEEEETYCLNLDNKGELETVSYEFEDETLSITINNKVLYTHWFYAGADIECYYINGPKDQKYLMFSAVGEDTVVPYTNLVMKYTNKLNVVLDICETPVFHEHGVIGISDTSSKLPFRIDEKGLTLECYYISEMIGYTQGEIFFPYKNKKFQDASCFIVDYCNVYDYYKDDLTGFINKVKNVKRATKKNGVRVLRPIKAFKDKNLKKVAKTIPKGDYVFPVSFYSINNKIVICLKHGDEDVWIESSPTKEYVSLLEYFYTEKIKNIKKASNEYFDVNWYW